MAIQGWIQIHRKLLEHGMWREKPFSRGQAWITMLLLTNHKPAKFLIHGEMIDCDRGQSVRSTETWARLFGWTRQKVRSFLKLLESEGMIKTEGLRKTTRLTIVNYETYQAPQPADNQQITHRQPTDNHQITTNNNVNTEKNEKKPVLWPIPGKTCEKAGCKLPAIYKDPSGSYDHFYCGSHMPESVKEIYGG